MLFSFTFVNNPGGEGQTFRGGCWVNRSVNRSGNPGEEWRLEQPDGLELSSRPSQAVSVQLLFL